MIINVLAQSPVNSNWWNFIQEVTNFYTLFAFIISAGLTALLIIMHSTGGLKSVTDSLLRDSQLTNHQFERIYKFTLLTVASLAIVLFLYLGYTTWLNRANKSSSTSPKVTINYPEVNEHIKAEKEYPNIRLRGTSENIPQNRNLWVFAYPVETSVFFPFDNQAVVDPNGSWSSNGVVGPINESDIRYQFIVVGADKNALTQIEEYIKKKKEDSNNNTGFQSLPAGSATYSTVDVIYSR
jgi:hypothetical protein